MVAGRLPFFRVEPEFDISKWHRNCVAPGCTNRSRREKQGRTVQQEMFVSEKFRQKRPSGSSSGIYFRQTSVVARLLFGRSVL